VGRSGYTESEIKYIVDESQKFTISEFERITTPSYMGWYDVSTGERVSEEYISFEITVLVVKHNGKTYSGLADAIEEYILRACPLWVKTKEQMLVYILCCLPELFNDRENFDITPDEEEEY